MKYLLGLILALSFFELQAYEVQVRKMSRDGELERSYVLSTNVQDKVVLDCQSFIQGLRIGEFESAYTFMMDPDECNALSKRIKSSIRKFQKHCIDIEDDIRADYTCQ